MNFQLLSEIQHPTLKYGFRVAFHHGHSLRYTIANLLGPSGSSREWDHKTHLYTDDGNLIDFFFRDKARMIEIYMRFNHS